MPFRSLGSALPTLHHFTEHWAQVEAESPGMTVRGVDLATWEQAFGTLRALYEDAIHKDSHWQIAIGDRDVRREAMREHLRLFRSEFPTKAKKTPLWQLVPKLPRAYAQQPEILTALRDCARVWNVYNQHSTGPNTSARPLVLSDGTTLERFCQGFSNLRNAYQNVLEAERRAMGARESRDRMLLRAAEYMRYYDKAVVVHLGPDHPLNASIPELCPPDCELPCPELECAWDEEADKAKLTWTYDGEEIDHFELRYHAGPRYAAAGEHSCQKIDPGLREFHTRFCLLATGSIALYKLYAVAKDGRESASHSVRVIRP